MLAHGRTQQHLQSECTGDAGCPGSAFVDSHLLPRQPLLVVEQQPGTALVVFGAALTYACAASTRGQAAFASIAPHQPAPSLTCQLQASLPATGQVETEVLLEAYLTGR